MTKSGIYPKKKDWFSVLKSINIIYPSQKLNLKIPMITVRYPADIACENI